jgi:hypothetical protein
MPTGTMLTPSRITLQRLNAATSAEILDHERLVVFKVFTDVTARILMLNNNGCCGQIHISERVVAVRAGVDCK